MPVNLFWVVKSTMHPNQLPQDLDPRIRLLQVAILVIGILCGKAVGDEARADRPTIERTVHRAVEYLSNEVASWKTEHKCYSCHHHGDGARALFAAARKTSDTKTPAIVESLEWLRRPTDWDHNGPDGPFSDRRLARIQFAGALAEAVQQQLVPDRKPLVTAAEQLVREQLPTGAWDFEGIDSLGGSITYGRALATAQARNILVLADRAKFRQAIERADAWLRQFEPRSVIDSAGVLIGIGEASDELAVLQRQRCLDIVKRGQTDEGGWGPYVTSGSEAFDTALSVLALSSQTSTRGGEMQAKGILYLIRSQLSDGSWPETTRPLPRESYSQRVSTSAWSLLAMLTQW